MVAKVVLFICAQALILKFTFGQCADADLDVLLVDGVALDDTIGSSLIGGEFGATALFGNARLCGSALSPIAAAALAPSTAYASHRVLPVSSVSVVPANGVTVASENAYDGEVNVRGALPFLGTLSLEGSLPNIGAGSVDFNCGNGVVAVLAENIGGVGIAGPLGYRDDAFGYGVGYNSGFYGRTGCGYRGLI